MRLYVDVEFLPTVKTGYAPEPGRAAPVAVFGPFGSRKRAERCLIAVAGRPDMFQAFIRDPDA